MSEELSPSQAAARIGATTRSVQRWITTGRLPARRLGGRWRVASDALDAFVRTTTVRTTAARTTAGELPIRRLFVANRGEIAGRIARTCQRLGIEVILPMTDGPSAIDLLDLGDVVGAALAANVDALHPGYGFLAESAALAEAVIKAGIRWVGPPPAAMRAMGDKAGARRLAAGLGVPILPGYDDPDQSEAAIAAAAQAIRTPLLVKPSAGGGGKGMRVVRDLEQLPGAVAAARREARAAFNDDRVILERYLDGPRHIEIQVLFDARGAGVHLGERDCSIQRRHQKILEESPSPALDDGLRSRMTAAALRLTDAVGYEGAGTVEFLVDDDGSFFFLEMNARLQVEHPVTELVTGRDLVADQLRIAAGEPLGFGQADVRAHGQAIEVRLYAEDAESGFLPATGRVCALRWPDGDGIRVDAGIDIGSEVTARFDPLLAKVIAHGWDRAEALARLREALDRTVVLGLTTNLRFLRWLVRQPAVLEGRTRIDTLERTWPPSDWNERARIPDEAWQAAARILLGSTDPPDPWGGAWRLNARPAVRLVAEAAAINEAIEATEASEATDRTMIVEAGPTESPTVLAGDTAHVDVDGLSVAFRLARPPDVDRAARSAARHHGSGPSQVIAPMPGGVIGVHVVVGATVDGGDPIATLEAMKMEHVVTAPVAGSVVDVRVRPADQVVRGQLLAVIEP